MTVAGDCIPMFPRMSGSSSSTSTNICVRIHKKANDKWQKFKVTAEELCDFDVGSELCVIYASSEPFLHQPPLHGRLSTKFHIPSYFWTNVAHEATGFYGCDDGIIDGEVWPQYTSWFRFLVKQPGRDPYNNKVYSYEFYDWHRMGCFTLWKLGHLNVVICFDLDELAEDRLQECFRQRNPTIFRDPYAVHSILVEEAVRMFDTSVWALRDLVRALEKNRSSVLPEDIDFIRFHELARHVLHSSETLAVALETLTSMVTEHQSVVQEYLQQDTTALCASKKVGSHLKYLTAVIKVFKGRSDALEARLRNEINLAYNLVAQHDSRTSVKIGRAAQSDSAAMKTIAVMTLVFLPGTFISAIFSMSFFNTSTNTATQQSHLTVTADFWLFWAVSVPVTIVTVALWFLWHDAYDKRVMGPSMQSEALAGRRQSA